jgi:hypothetical protein
LPGLLGCRILAAVLAPMALFLYAPAAQAIQDNTLNGTPLSMWQTNGQVLALAVANGTVYAGGDFSSARPPGDPPGTGEVARNHIAAFDSSTGGLISSFNHSLDGTVRAMAVSPDRSTLYVAGEFTHVDNAYRPYIASFSTATGSLTSWSPKPNGKVFAVATYGTAIYFGGTFTKVNGITHARLAAANSSGALLPWNPSADAVVYAVAVPPGGSRVIVGGNFANLNGTGQYRLAAVDPISGGSEPALFVPFPSTMTSQVKTIVTDSTGNAYIGAEGTGHGVFDGTWSVDYTTGAENWSDWCLGATQALALLHGWVFVGSHMHDCSGKLSGTAAVPGGPPQVPSRTWRLVVESQADGHVGHWFPGTNGNPLGPKSMATDGNQLFVGGDFTMVNSKAQQGLTRFGGPPDTTVPSRPAAPGASTYCAGQVHVAFQNSNDIDDGKLTYNLYRDGGTAPIYSTQLTADPWENKVDSFTDPVAPGSAHTYKLSVTDGSNVTAKVSSPSVTVASTTDQYPCDIVGRKPFLYWRLDESSGTVAKDGSGDGQNGIYQSGVSQGVQGAPIGDGDRAAQFNGTSSGFVSSRKWYWNPQNFMLDFWFKTSPGYSSGGKIIGFGNQQSGISSAYDRHVYMTNAGRLIFGVWEGVPVLVQSAASYNDGDWHHAVASIDSTNGMALYVDGVKVASHAVDSNGNYGRAEFSGGYWRVGGDSLYGWPQRPSSDFFQGTIDEVTLFA